ncbi:hypothetical protein EXIGLDRAFT_764374 [Exidia glandulosa HHB12029]|uniref:RRM domain-containing protein n=1 Tax=Exidia glandulosa HHB12029 TaxID=1314781 RepID=A0A165L6B5_EXIGL|nr:hypothetical protein EXIGLDRAFT_764374 [Exidia glandulosa HHB12029]
MSLNEFLGDSTLGSWADEMDSLPSAPAPRTDDDYGGRGDRDFGRGGDRDFTRSDRNFPPREELPLPTRPPFTAFIGNLSFDLTEREFEDFFAGHKTVSVKIIKDREDKPKGFGYVEFADVEGLKAALAMNGTSMGNRTIRVNVAEPPKEREGRGGYGDRGGSAFDEDKFAGEWRRSGPLPERSPPRRSRFGGGGDDGPERRSRFDDGPDRGSRFAGSERESGPAEEASDWRSNRPARQPPPELSVDMPPPDRPVRRSGFPTPTGGPSGGDLDAAWERGAKFKPSPISPAQDRGPRQFGSVRSDRSSIREPSVDNEPSDWRSAPRRPLGNGPRAGGFGDSPANSTPPTPVLARRKLELTPRTSAPQSSNTSPLGSPKFASAQTTTTPPTKSSPFGAAKPVDVTQREKEVAERLEREKERTRDVVRERSESTASTSVWGPRRTGTTSGGPPSRQVSRPPSPGGAAPPTPSVTSPISPRIPASTVRPAFSFANAAKSASGKTELEDVTEKVAEVSV